ncbi:ABC transporter permease [Clostridium sediminicola]|uniref:ABC transporter permease n=1 Tax=Clostridium sediminicola TaxID=3114879 RepID=UPI0031F226A2
MNRKGVLKRLEDSIYPIISILIFLVIWHLGVTLTSLKVVMPSPITVIQEFLDSFIDPIGKYKMVYHVFYSLMRVVPAYIVGSILGILLGILMGWYPKVNAIFRPIYELIRPIPPIAWIPISIIWFGIIGEGSKWYLIFLASFVPITLNAFAGAKSVDPTLIKCSKMLGATDRQVFSSVVLPSSVPYIFAGLQVGLSGAWATVVAAEMIRSTEGVGWIIISSMDTNDITQNLVGIVAIGIVGFFLAVIMRKVEEKLCAWNKREI